VICFINRDVNNVIYMFTKFNTCVYVKFVARCLFYFLFALIDIFLIDLRCVSFCICCDNFQTVQ